ncbi:MAG TPA: cyclic nucleotide-binding domain-containing protein [Nitrososphaerales archaeon]|nr:cyclic nucleotide-binding domain-containing protein [Nitrososphaerales archaeon]
MPPETTSQLLSKVPILSSMSASDLKRFEKAGRELTFQTGKKILAQGDTGVGFYMVLDGEVEVRRAGKLVAKLGRGDFFGELSLLDKMPRNADVVALKPTRCFTLVSWAFEGLVKSNPKIALKMMEEVARRLRGSGDSITH